jgi:hypothetical protein
MKRSKIDELIAKSSFGTAAARRLRAKTPRALVKAIVERAEDLDSTFPRPYTTALLAQRERKAAKKGSK